jgi:hypothetical protein
MTLDSARPENAAARLSVVIPTLPDVDTAEDLRRAISDPRVSEALRRKLTSALTNSDR